MNIEKLNEENKKILDERLLFILDEYDSPAYLLFLWDKLSIDEKFRIILQLEKMVKNKRGGKNVRNFA